MKKILSMIALSAAVVFSGCDKESENHSFVTLLPQVELLGDEEVIYLEVGDSYTDEGAEVLLGGKPTNDYTVTNTVNTDKAGLYFVTYKMTNDDGYSASATRTVYVTDPTFQTLWFKWVTVKVANDVIEDIYLQFEKIDDTHIACEDLLGGYYMEGMGYGKKYSAPGVMEISEPDAEGWAEVVDYEGGVVAGWGDCIDGVTGKINLKTGEYHIVTDYYGNGYESYSAE